MGEMKMAGEEALAEMRLFNAFGDFDALTAPNSRDTVRAL